ncbi:YfbM family protein [Pseudonocardia lacus]|uniref:YfbM family protein n=1 Tax=Pseudonocardia lacus TaxID=2835865 RepID=UPI001BDD4342|nr:YfbM family protein [Pseudonocardia lacus]
MGLDVRMVPVRLDSPALRAIRDSADTWEQADLHPPFGSGGRGEPLPAVNREIAAQVPEGFGTYHPFPGRTQEQAEYLLDPAARGRSRSYEERERTPAYRAVFGDERFAEHTRSGQGMRWRCSGSGFLVEAAARIDALDAVARRGFTVAGMVELGVYKVHPDADDDETFALVLGELRALARWYHRLVDRGLDVIVIVY